MRQFYCNSLRHKRMTDNGIERNYNIDKTIKEEIMRILARLAAALLVTLLFSLALSAGELHDAVRNNNLDQVKQLLESGLEALNERGPDGAPPLCIAANEGRIEILTYLLDTGADITVGDNENTTPFHHAAIGGQIEAAKLLLSRGANLEEKDDHGNTALMWACSFRQSEMVRFLIEKGADTNAESNRGWRPLLHAAIGGEAEILELLLKNGADPNSRFAGEIVALHSASSYARTEAVKLLVSHGADVDARDEHGETPLCWARNANCAEVVNFLIANGANVKHRSDANRTPLHNVAQRGTVEIAKILLENGADINAVDDAGWSPLTTGAMANVDIVEYLILRGAEINPPCPPSEDNKDECVFCMKPIHSAARFGGVDVLKALVENGAKINVLDDRHLTPLHWAIISDNTDAFEYLLSKGAFTQSPELHFERTELHTAAANGRRDMVKRLVNAGADASAVDHAGKTASDLAFYHGFRDIGYNLLAAGASDEGLADLLNEPNRLETAIPAGQAVIWHLGHSGWAVKTMNHLMIFDYLVDPERPAPPGFSLASGYINPTELQNQNVTVFSSHGHWDHYDSTYMNWRETIPNIEYIFGHRPRGEERQYNYIEPRVVETFDGIKVSTINSTDAGVGFLIEVDGLVILHPGDHANGGDGLSEDFTAEIDYLADVTPAVDIAFLPVTGCSLGDPESVKRGYYYTVEKLSPKLMFPMHGGNNNPRYKEYAEEARELGLEDRFQFPIDKGDRFMYGVKEQVTAN
jgi:ankyrin repeat protein